MPAARQPAARRSAPASAGRAPGYRRCARAAAAAATVVAAIRSASGRVEIGRQRAGSRWRSARTSTELLPLQPTGRTSPVASTRSSASWVSSRQARRSRRAAACRRRPRASARSSPGMRPERRRLHGRTTRCRRCWRARALQSTATIGPWRAGSRRGSPGRSFPCRCPARRRSGSAGGCARPWRRPPAPSGIRARRRSAARARASGASFSVTGTSSPDGRRRSAAASSASIRRSGATGRPRKSEAPGAHRIDRDAAASRRRRARSPAAAARQERSASMIWPGRRASQLPSTRDPDFAAVRALEHGRPRVSLPVGADHASSRRARRSSRSAAARRRRDRPATGPERVAAAFASTSLASAVASMRKGGLKRRLALGRRRLRLVCSRAQATARGKRTWTRSGDQREPAGRDRPARHAIIRASSSCSNGAAGVSFVIAPCIVLLIISS